MIYSLLAAAAVTVDATEAAGPRSPDEGRTPVSTVCQQLADRLASVGLEECRRLRLEATDATSIGGVPILIRDFPPLEARRPLGRVLLFGGIHGDELSSVSIVFKWLGLLDRFHSGLFHWRIVPVLNPDGLLSRPGSRTNAHGVDLNRNFPTPDWHAQTRDYWVGRTQRNPRRYPGTDPLSEPESRFLAEQIESFAPDVIVSVHAPHSVLDFDGPSKPPQRLGSLHLKLLGTYPGSLGRWAGVHMNIPVVTIELPSAGSMPSYGEQRAIWMDLVRWLKQSLPASRPRQRVVRDATDCEPSTAVRRPGAHPVADARPCLASADEASQ